MIVNKTTENFLLNQLLHFLAGPRCCQHFSGSLRTCERIILAECAIKFGFRSHPFVRDGIHSIKIYKRGCSHYLEEPCQLKLQIQTTKDLFWLLTQSNFIGSQSEMEMSLNYCTNNKPILPEYRFATGPLKQTIASEDILKQDIKHNIAFLPFREKFLTALAQNKILIVNGEPIFDKSLSVPLHIIEECAKTHTHCKIICIQRDAILAIINSERLAGYINEKVGLSVAYQVPLKSCISESSNVIYTTAEFFLRVLMGQNKFDSFRHISHVIIDDVQMHNAFSDLLLYELREVLHIHAHLKVILLSYSYYNAAFIRYFGEGEEINLQKTYFSADGTVQGPDVMYINEIRRLVSNKSLQCVVPTPIVYPKGDDENIQCNYQHLDECLRYYELIGNEGAFNSFLYMVQGEFASINFQHSVTGNTAAIIAAKHGQAKHLRTLLQLHADPFITNKEGMDAVSSSHRNGNKDCILLLKTYCDAGLMLRDINPAHLDYSLIIEIIRLLTLDWKPGNILIFVANFKQLLKVNFSILRHKTIGNLPQQIEVHVIHNGIEKEQFELICRSNPARIKIIIATEIAESIAFLLNINYVIDTARYERCIYNTDFACKQHTFEWISQEKLEMRSALISSILGYRGASFRLIPGTMYNQLQKVHTPELLSMPLDRVCLTVKLLAEHKLVAEYLKDTIICPSFIHVHQTVEFLKKLGVLDSHENATWLACRIVDLPIDCQLGKLIVFSIMMECLDPILTIASFMTMFDDPLQLPYDMEEIIQPFASIIRSNKKAERDLLSENSFSDHFMYLRLFQKWQSNYKEYDEFVLVDEHNFVFNGILEKIDNTRSILVAALRFTQLVHNQGPLSMHFINLKSDNWAMVRATLVGGLYPNICWIDKHAGQIKSGKNQRLVLHPSSSLRKLKVEPLKEIAKRCPSLWIIYGKEANSAHCNSIGCCTLVTPASVALFAGPMVLNAGNIVKQLPTNSNVSDAYFYLDDWIWLTVNANDAYLIFKARQKFFNAYADYLQHCCNLEKLRHNSFIELINSLEEIVTREDMSFNLPKFRNVGLRPRSVPPFLITMNKSANLLNFFGLPIHEETLLQDKSILLSAHAYGLSYFSQKLFLAYISDTLFQENASTRDWLYGVVAEEIAPYILAEKLTFVFIYDRNTNQFCGVCMARWSFGQLRLQECFKNSIGIIELERTCLRYKIPLPELSEKLVVIMEPALGKMLLEMFAYRNIWLYK